MFKKWSVGPASQRKAVWFGEDINAQCMDGELAEKMVAEHNAAIDALEAAEAKACDLKEKNDELQRQIAEHRQHISKLMKELAALKNPLPTLQDIQGLYAGTTPAEVPSRRDIQFALHEANPLDGKGGIDYVACAIAVQALYAPCLERLGQVVAPTEVPSDEELAKIGEAAHTEYWATVNADHAWEHAVRAVREAVEAPWRAEVERLRQKIEHDAQWESSLNRKMHNLRSSNGDLQTERDRLREQLEAERAAAVRESINSHYVFPAAQKTTTRPVKVRFDVTAEDVSEALKQAQQDAPLNQRGMPVRIFCGARILDYLADHTVIDVPEGVPTAGEIAEAYKKYKEDTVSWKNDGCKSPTGFAYEMLAPYLQPSAAVDPKLCETPFQESWFSVSVNGNFITVKIPQGNESPIVGTVLKSKAHELGLWLLSFAAKNGIDVRLPVKPLKALHELGRQQRECYERVFYAALEVERWDEDGDKPFQTNKEAVADAHDCALKAARTLPKRLAELDAAIREGGAG